MDRNEVFERLLKDHPRGVTKFPLDVLPAIRNEFEAGLIMFALERAPHHYKTLACKLLGISRVSLQKRIKTLNIKTIV